ncbi:SpoIIE family protein phosphatase [Streptomyces sp. NPDC020747]|uniref:ATP-binding SpoIIE family protein phosphatase n=1 Tax=Streptomyces sp. NPDC020747 TaxID=3365086 RepID=UPI0037906E79
MAQRGSAVRESPHDHRPPADLATIVVGAHGEVLGWSDDAQRLLGHSPAVVGHAVTELLAVDDSPAWDALATGEAWSGPVEVRHRDGHRLVGTLRACPSLGGQGKAHGWSVVAVTVSPHSSGNRTQGAGTAGGSDRAMLEPPFAQASVALATFDAKLRYLQVNSLHVDMLGTGEAQLHGRSYADVLPDGADGGWLRQLRQVAETASPARYDGYIGDRAWSVEMWPVKDSSGRMCGVGTAAFDNSEQHGAHQRLALLNQAGARIGTALDVGRTARELAQVVVPNLADFVTVDLFDSVLEGDEPTPYEAGEPVLLRRAAALSAVEGVPELAVELGAVDTYPPFSPPARCLAAARPLLSGLDDPDFVRWIEGDEIRSAGVHRDGIHSGMAVPLRARGMVLGVVVLWRSTRPGTFQQDDLLLVEELAGRAAVSMDNARRYTREHAAALTMQRSLLPQVLPQQAAVEAAFRYLPASSESGVGGDWFDVIPLSGTRVALVVGDVVGHGVHASAAMGRLRTAVRTLADVDLPPDELLTHIDDLVTHLGSDDDGVGLGGPGVGEFGATCLYAVYDPVSRRFTLASAGHPPPSVLYPDGTVVTIGVSPGPPLGVGGVPFEITELELPESSLIALHTDGLVDAHHRDLDLGFARLRDSLAAASPSLEATCDTLIGSMLPERPADDVALLVARTRALHADQVATWGLPVDPEVVADARAQASRQLAAWGLEEASFITELVVSELVTNAIRYGEAPIQLRLIRDRTLICEVSDGSSTAPHLRRARTFDEGGRGLLLVAQLTQGWGTRHTSTGKTIWAEQLLPNGPGWADL